MAHTGKSRNQGHGHQSVVRHLIDHVGRDVHADIAPDPATAGHHEADIVALAGGQRRDPRQRYAITLRRHRRSGRRGIDPHRPEQARHRQAGPLPRPEQLSGQVGDAVVVIVRQGGRTRHRRYGFRILDRCGSGPSAADGAAVAQ